MEAKSDPRLSSYYGLQLACLSQVCSHSIHLPAPSTVQVLLHALSRVWERQVLYVPNLSEYFHAKSTWEGASI